MRVELHRHLDASFRLETLLRLAQERGLEGESTSPAGFREKFVIRNPLQDLSTVLAQFTLFQKVLDRPEVLERLAFETIEDCRTEGTRKVELRFSPSFVSAESHLSWSEILESFDRGRQRALQTYPEMEAGFICIASRDFGEDEVGRTVDFFLAHRDRFIGLDLAGNESGFPCRLFEFSFRKARSAGAKITVHAGEASGPENIWEAFELLGAQRIGHGISSLLDPKLMDFLRKNKICLEMCPTSNWLTQAVPSLAEHPLPRVLRAGIPVCINTDDPAIFGVNLDHEVEICRQKLGMSPEEIELCFQHARDSSFF